VSVLEDQAHIFGHFVRAGNIGADVRLEDRMHEITHDDSVHQRHAQMVDGVEQSLKHVHAVGKGETEKRCHRVRRWITGLRQRSSVESYRIDVDERSSKMVGQANGALRV